jgi:hypothetical protein
MTYKNNRQSNTTQPHICTRFASSRKAPRRFAALWPQGAACALIGLLVSMNALARKKESRPPAGIQNGLTQIAAGKRLCATGKHSKGVAKIFEAAVTLQKADAAHPANKKWRPALRRCLRGWIKSLGKQCKPEPATLKRLDALARLAKQAKKIAERSLARTASARRKACIAQIGAKVRKLCHEEPGPQGLKLARKLVRALEKDKDKVAPRAWKRLAGAPRYCALQWSKSAALRCSGHPSLAVLKELGDVVRATPKPVQDKPRRAYENCAKALGRYGWQLCQNRRYARGHKLLSEAVGRYDFHAAKDHAFRKKMKTQWLPYCGTYVARLKARSTLKVSNVDMKLVLDGRLILAKTQKPNRLKGIFRVSVAVKKAKSPAGEVTATITPTVVRVGGVYNPKTQNMAWWPQKTPPPKKSTESIQITPPKKSAIILRDTASWDLLQKTGLFKMWMSARPRAEKRISYKGGLGGGRQADFQGTLEAARLDK